MSTLNQFFGKGGGIPAEVLVVNGGSGASYLSFSNPAPGAPSPYACFSYVQGRGGAVATAFFDITPGTTCSIVVGAGGSSRCRVIPAAPSLYCLGSSGCASRFGDFGGTDRTQPPQACTTCLEVYLPYAATYPLPFCGNRVQDRIPYNGFDSYAISGGPCVGIVAYSTNGHFGGCFLPILPCPLGNTAADIMGAKGYVSKITGTVQTYGSAKDITGCNQSASVCAVCSGRPHPNTIGPGSGHGAYYCDTGIVAAEPGTVIIQYPDDFNAASVSSPSVCDCSPATPGFRTYRFLCPGSITFP